MKNTIKLLGIIALVAVMGFAMTACGDDSSSSGFSTAGLPSIKKAGDIPNYDGSAATEEQASQLWDSFIESSFFEFLSGADWYVFESLVDDKYDGFDSLIDANLDKKSVSASVNFNDSTELVKNANISAGTIKGSSSSSWSSNLTLEDYYYGGLSANNDTYSTNRSRNREFAITGGHYADNGVRIKGYVTTNASNGYKETVKDSNIGSYTSSYDYLCNASIAISISSGTSYGAKFRFAIAEVGNGAARSVNWNDSIIFSDLEVLDNAGNIITVIPADWVYGNWDILGFAYYIASFYFD